jgi:hypothetical protein
MPSERGKPSLSAAIKTEPLPLPVYRKGNPYQKRMYEHLARYNAKRGQQVFGKSRGGSAYAHLLPEADALRNFLDDERILAALKARFALHKAGDEWRALTNSAASQVFCFNLIVPLAADLGLASRLFSALMDQDVSVAHIEVEFTPNAFSGPSGFAQGDQDESLGDQSGTAGTDADVAVFLSVQGRRQILLIETKLIEAEFSSCASYRRKPSCKAACPQSDFYQRLVLEAAVDEQGRPLCGYTTYRNWALTSSSRAFDSSAIESSPACPFRYSGQQLWRNLLLAETVCLARRLDDFAFWVLAPADNLALWQDGTGDVEIEFRRLLTPYGNQRFRRITMQDVYAALEGLLIGTPLERWLIALRDKYIPDGQAERADSRET